MDPCSFKLLKNYSILYVFHSKKQANKKRQKGMWLRWILSQRTQSFLETGWYFAFLENMLLIIFHIVAFRVFFFFIIFFYYFRYVLFILTACPLIKFVVTCSSSELFAQEWFITSLKNACKRKNFGHQDEQRTTEDNNFVLFNISFKM